MILIDDTKVPLPSPSALEAQQTSSRWPPTTPPPARPSTDSDPLLPQPQPSSLTYCLVRPSSTRSLSPPPEYTPPQSKVVRSARGRFCKALLAAVAIYLAAAVVLAAVVGEGSGLAELPSEEDRSSPSPLPSPIPRPSPAPPKIPHVPKQPSNRWDSSFYLPPLSHGHVVGCAPVSLSTKVVYDLSLPTPTLALRFATARPRRPGQSASSEDDAPIEPLADVRVLPWLEDEDTDQWGEWMEGSVKVVVEVAEGREGDIDGQTRHDPLQVCHLSDAQQAGVGIYSASSRPSHLVVTVLVPMSEYTDRYISSLIVDGVVGSLYVGDMLLTKEAETPDFGRGEPGWTSLDVRMQRGEVMIEALDVEDLSIVGLQSTDILVGAMRVSRSLEVSTGSEGHGRFVIGNLLLEPDCVCKIESQSGAVQANVSLVSEHAPPSLTTSDLTSLSGLPGLPGDSDLPSKPRFPSQPKLAILHPVKLSVISVEGNVTLRVLEHLPHIPLQADLRSAGSIAAFLTPSFQGYFSLASPHLGLVQTVLPPSGTASTISDPFGLSRKLVVHRAEFARGIVEGSLGWGWAGKPDLEGSVKATSERGAISVEMARTSPPL